jgi:hypothetical protein
MNDLQDGALVPLPNIVSRTMRVLNQPLALQTEDLLSSPFEQRYIESVLLRAHFDEDEQEQQVNFRHFFVGILLFVFFFV